MAASRSFRLIVWLLVSICSGTIGLMAGFKTVLPGPSSLEALRRNPGELLALHHGVAPLDEVLVLLRHPSFLVSDPEFIDARESLVQLLREMRRGNESGGLFSAVVGPGHTWISEQERAMSSEDGHAILVRGETKIPVYEAASALAMFPTAISAWQERHTGFVVSYLSTGTGDSEIFEVIHRDLDQSLQYTLPLTFIILVCAFESIVAALIPLGVALVSLFCSLGLAALVSILVGPISATATQLVVLLVLAIGVDYSLFMVSRVREERRRGESLEDAVCIAQHHTGTAIWWSGLTVAVSLLGLFLMRDAILTSMAAVSLLAVFVTVGGCLWALPSVIYFAGPYLESGKVTFPAWPGRGLRWSVALSLRYPLAVALASATALLVVASALFGMRLGSTMEGAVLPPAMQSARAFQELHTLFPAFAGSRFDLVFQAPSLIEREDEGQLQPFLDALLTDERVHGPVSSQQSADGTVKRMTFVVLGDANDSRNHELMRTLRQDLSPQLFKQGIEAHVSGKIPYVLDESQRYHQGTRFVLLAVLSISMIFLLMAFRSIVIPFKAMALNLLSTGASFGTLVILFQGSIQGGWNYGVIESFVPALLFAILFGLSMDYHVFLISRIQEEFQRGVAVSAAVEKGIVSTSRSITSAALIMASVFGVIATLELPIMKQLGVGLAIAIIIDATVVRCLLLPASMVLLGEWNWYLPRWLRWLPRVEM